jgi:RND superfamily putative drug exporter
VPVRRSRGRGDDARADREDERRPPLTLRHPRRTLAVASLFIVLLLILGTGLDEKLSPTTIEISGTPAAKANHTLEEHFGPTALFPILLQGPAAEIDRQGPELIRTLRRENPKVTTLSPWDRGAVGRLRPGPRRALILADFHVDNNQAVDETVPYLERTLETKIQPPVRATQTGFATISKAIQDESIDAAERAELIALPILLVVLLLVFRSPIAALIPLTFGALSVFSSRGLLALLTHWFGVDALALTVCTMMGLALGVDYSLLMVSRFREELAEGADPLEAAWTTRRTAGRTTVFAGSTLVLSMVAALFVAPGALLTSLAGTLALVVVLTVLVATLVGPPVLVLLGPNVDRWRIGPAPSGDRSWLMSFVSGALRHPAPVAALIGAVVLLLAAPAAALKTGPPDPSQLPKDDPVRQDAELIGSSVGRGEEAPFTLIATADRGTITEPDRLAALTRWQNHLSALPGVQTVIGPGQVARGVAPLRSAGTALYASNEKSGPIAGLDRLGRNLGRVAGGVGRLRSGLAQATAGAGLLAEGSGNAEEGAFQIAQGLGKATAGSQEALSSLDRFAKGTRKLSAAQQRAATGAFALKLNLPDVATNLRNNGLRRSHKVQKTLFNDADVKAPQLQAAAQATDEQVAAALRELEGMTAGKSDPNYGPALEAARKALAAVSGTDPASGQPYAPEYAGLPTELTALQARLLEDAQQTQVISRFISSESTHIDELAALAKRLSEGLYEISAAGKKIAAGAAKINRESKQLSAGLSRLGSGATELAGGLTRLVGGTTTLEHGLGEIYSRSQPIQTGLRRASVRVLSQSATANRRLSKARNGSPGIFNSGYFVLSALDGTRGRVRERAAEAIDIEDGGQAATVFVMSDYPFNSPGSIDLNKRLDTAAGELADETGLTVGVAGGPPTVNAYTQVTRARMPLLIAVITLATFLVLVLVLRALPLAALAVGLNLLTVAVAFGVLTLLSHVPDSWPLGGHAYVEAVGVVMIFGVVFGLSIDYAVFLLVRMREHYDLEQDNAAAIKFGLEKTARVITGAAAIMMAVFIAFAGAPIATVSQLGVGLTIAVLLDATVVRIVLLPALMLLIGDRIWWLPRSLERVLPRLNV